MPVRPAKFAAHMAGFAAAMLTSVALAPALAAAAGPVQFNRDIRPILSDNCFACHGPDSAQRKADLRLDVEQSAKAEHDGIRPVAPLKRAESELYRRVTSSDADEHMPPLASGKKLTAAQIELLGRWIDEGAKWEQHWAFIPPVRPNPPPVEHANWLRNPIDAFVLARLESEGLSPAPEAGKTTLLRRVTLDLTGLPPTPAEVDVFLADTSAGAYERAVDRLLASPRYGERMAARWLDAARYADTSGYQTDGIRYMWRWRDWVIEAFNRNLPFDQFTIQQIAGDMLMDATLDERIATGFNRNHRGNAEGGIIAEEYAVEYVVDRVDTTATVWLGLTIGCARCHDHKFDPITQREFYQVFAFFNNVPERGRAIKVGNSPPMLKSPTRDEQAQLAILDAELLAAEAALAARQADIARLETEWASSFSPSGGIVWAPSDALSLYLPLDQAVAMKPAPGEGDKSSASRIEESSVTFAPGITGTAAQFDAKTFITAGDEANFGYFDKFTFSVWISPQAADGTIISRMAESPLDADGYSLQLADGKLQVNLVKRWLDDALRVETVEPIGQDQWHHVAVTYDGSRVAEGVKVYLDGRPQQLKVLLDELNQSFESKESLRIGGGGPATRFTGAIDEVRIYKSDLPASEIDLLATRAAIDAIVVKPAGGRTKAEAGKLRAYFLEQQAPQDIRELCARLLASKKRKASFEESFATTMVMEELPTPRDTFVLVRGQYDKPSDKVSADIPASLNPLPSDGRRDRLAFARWLVDRSNPLTARVTVNRFWQMYFGAGLVKTVDDFGAQGDAPSHSELLDWLATEFMDREWDTKAMQRLIVTSAAYQQSSKVTPQLLERDPENRLLARGPRFRLSAETIRDSALAASGLVVERLGGPSVNPYQPPGLWKELTGGGDFVQDHGASLYRRSLYTFWKRTIAPPSMMTFDASGREACSVRETRTNTPLQALTLMNEITFVEAARALAERTMREAETPRDRISLGFRLATARPPGERETEVLLSGLARHQRQFAADPPAAEKLLKVGEAPLDPRLDARELAAYAAVMNLILNLDEVVTKE